MGVRTELIKGFPTYLEQQFEEVGVFKALRAPIVFRTLKDKLFLLGMVIISLAQTIIVVIKLIRWII